MQNSTGPSSTVNKPPTKRQRNPEEHESPRKKSRLSTEPQYSKEQIEAVRKVNKCQNHYDILDVPPNINEEGIQIAYKKLAKLLHPDKNKSPGATQAFQKLQQAKEILSNAEKRQIYDEELQEELMSQQVQLLSDATLDIPMSLVVMGGIAVAAGLFSWWWDSSHKDKDEKKRK